MIDLHSHILPAVDDGVATPADALELARAAVADGVTTIAATPHVRADFPTTPERMEQGVAELRRALAEHGVPLVVVHGGELDALFAASLDDDAVRRFSFGQVGRHVLLEFPYRGWPHALEGSIGRLLARGVVPLLAHPERNAQVQEEPARLAPLVAGGCLVQVTAASVDGRLGKRPRAAAAALIERGLVHVLASDAHAPGVRAVGLAAAAEAVGDAALARFLTEDAPAAILAGEAVPPPPRRTRRRFGLWTGR